MPTSNFITLRDGCRLATRLDGPAGAPLVVLSNSLGTTLAMWDAQVDALASRYRVLRYDSRGHGASDAPGGPYTIARLGADVLELLDALDVPRARFCGVSMGGMVGQWLGANAPERLERLVLSNTAAFMGPASAWQERIDRVRAAGMEAIADGVLARWFTPAFAARAPEVRARMRAAFVATSPSGYAACCAAIRDMDLREDAARIAPRTMLIAAAEDLATPPARAHEIASAMARPTEIVTLAGAHLCNVEVPALWNETVMEFLR